MSKFLDKFKYFTTFFFLLELNNAALPSQSSCGAPVISPNIVGSSLNRIILGADSISNSWPWQVSLRIYDRTSSGRVSVSEHFCGGKFIYIN